MDHAIRRAIPVKAHTTRYEPTNKIILNEYDGDSRSANDE